LQGYDFTAKLDPTCQLLKLYCYKLPSIHPSANPNAAVPVITSIAALKLLKYFFNLRPVLLKVTIKLQYKTKRSIDCQPIIIHSKIIKMTVKPGTTIPRVLAT
jgi:hypothetical protein